MNQYLLTFLIKKDLDEKDQKALIESVKKNIDKVLKEDLWGVRDLAYPIQKQTSAFYVHYEFESDPAKISNLDKFLKLHEDILRYLIVRDDIKPAKKKNNKQVISKKEESDGN